MLCLVVVFDREVSTGWHSQMIVLITFKGKNISSPQTLLRKVCKSKFIHQKKRMMNA